ncbi:MAG: FecCD family ABC transporter permease, partial [Candidatus Syntropharchaeia archaeon]
MENQNHLEKIRGWKIILLMLSAALILSIVFGTALGPVRIPIPVIKSAFMSILLGTPMAPTSIDYPTIIFQIRLPRVFLGALVGASLAIAGATMQGLFKNPMADPYIIGISSGAAVGAVFGMTILSGIFGTYTVSSMAFLGGAGTIFLVYNIARVGGKVPIDTLLLSGIAVSCFLSAVVSFMMYVSGEGLHQIVFWLMGGLWNADWNDVKMVTIPISLGIFMIYFFARDLNAMLLGEETAHHLGVSVENVKKILLLLASLITATAVSVSGIIGFVGLIIPHIVRLVVGPDHRILLPSSAFVGGIFLIWTDTLARTIIAP